MNSPVENEPKSGYPSSGADLGTGYVTLLASLYHIMALFLNGTNIHLHRCDHNTSKFTSRPGTPRRKSAAMSQTPTVIIVGYAGTYINDEITQLKLTCDQRRHNWPIDSR